MVHALGVLTLLWCHVVHRAHRCLRHGQGRVRRDPQQFSETKIGDLHLPFFGDENVLWLDVAVDDSFIVRKLQRCANLHHKFKGLVWSDGLEVEQGAQVHPVHIFHDEVVILPGVAEVINVDDTRMIEFGQGPGFPAEALGKGGMWGGSLRQDFQGDDSIQVRLASLVDHAHAAHADQFNDLQLRELRRQLSWVRWNTGARPGLGQRVDIDGGTRPRRFAAQSDFGQA